MAGITTPALQVAAILAQNTAFAARCQLIAIQYAVNFVLGENPATTNHTARIALARTIIKGTLDPVILARVVLTDSGIQTAALADKTYMGVTITDALIDGKLQNSWDAMSNL